ncbi:MAG: hypothetical protein K1X64_23755 [Myxococcaceae bacterium]|nr:hypothetical protein [Myxococcaceae bacterium]
MPWSFRLLLAAVIATYGVGYVLAVALPLAPQAREAALLAVKFSAASGLLAAVLKRWSMSRQGAQAMSSALLSMAVTGAVRAGVVLVGLLTLRRANGDLMAFVVAFFAIYFVQQIIEVSYVHFEQKRQTQAALGT